MSQITFISYSFRGVMWGAEERTDSVPSANRPSSALRIRHSSLSLWESSSGISGSERTSSRIFVSAASTTTPAARLYFEVGRTLCNKRKRNAPSALVRCMR